MEDQKIINPQKVYNVNEAAKVLDINEQTLLDYVRTGKIIGKKIGEWKILGQSLINFLTAEPNEIERPDEADFYDPTLGQKGYDITKGGFVDPAKTPWGK